MKNKQKAWRTRASNPVVRMQLAVDHVQRGGKMAHAGDLLRTGKSRIRIGHKLRDGFVKLLPVPSPLVQGLMIRAGITEAD